jgi:hypothetical protein
MSLHGELTWDTHSWWAYMAYMGHSLLPLALTSLLLLHVTLTLTLFFLDQFMEVPNQFSEKGVIPNRMME